MCTADSDALLTAAHRSGIAARLVGHAGGDRLVVAGLVDLAVAEIASVRSNRLPEAADRASA
jgi:hypothetical protein